MPVATLARFTVVETAAGERPVLRRIVELVGPKPMPRAPSTMAAQKPASPISSRSPISDQVYGDPGQASTSADEVLQQSVVATALLGAPGEPQVLEVGPRLALGHGPPGPLAEQTLGEGDHRSPSVEV